MDKIDGFEKHYISFIDKFPVAYYQHSDTKEFHRHTWQESAKQERKRIIAKLKALPGYDTHPNTHLRLLIRELEGE